MAGETLIDVRDLTMRLGCGAAAFVLEAPMLRIRRGRFVGVVGKSGSGKSTLLDVLSLVAQPTAVGAFRIHTTPAATPVDVGALWARGSDGALAGIRRRHMGYVLQSGGLCGFLSAEDNIALPMRMNGAPDAATRPRALLARLGMAGHAGRDVRTLSGGERQRIAILRALAHDPAVIFADEPTAALDFDTARRAVRLLAELAQDRAASVIMVTHDRELVDAVADDCIVLGKDERAGAGTRFVARQS
jgi:putative ABC transport system ATP-binding protein